MPEIRKYWEDKAAEARAEAARMSIEASRQLLLEIARSYEQLAAAAAETESDNKEQDKG
jgi:hypothetical protein